MLRVFVWVFVGLVVLIVWLILGASKNEKQASGSKTSRLPKPSIKMLNRDGDAYEDEWHTYIAGLKHHISKYDIGGFTGYVVKDPHNEYDRNAMAVVSSIKQLGYIPAKELLDYIQWSNGAPMPCVGFIYVDDGQYRGRVKILWPCSEEFLQTEFSRYLQWVKDNYGNEYLPKTMSMRFDIE